MIYAGAEIFDRAAVAARATTAIDQNSDRYRDLLPLAITMASKYHDRAPNRINKDGTPYILHPLRLMMQASTYAAKIVAILHDTIEDTELSQEDLSDAGFDDFILNAVDALTKREGEEYEAAMQRVSKNPLATQIKLLDLHDNIDLTRLSEVTEWDLKRTAKYHRAIRFLQSVQERNK